MHSLTKAVALALLALLIAGVRMLEAAPSTHPPMHAEGAGAVTVVFESGLGDTGDVWRFVQAAVADHCARTVSYDRRGYGESAGAAHGVRDAQQIVEELRARLADAGLPPPYVLVGHSLGGLYVQYFARRYPGEVQGLLLVDSMHWDQLNRVRTATPGVYRVTSLAATLRGGVVRREFAGIPATAAALDGLPRNEQVPTIVLSSTQVGMGETPEFRSLAAQLQVELAAAYATRSHHFLLDSGHYIQLDQPRTVVKAARELSGCDVSPMANERSLHRAGDYRFERSRCPPASDRELAGLRGDRDPASLGKAVDALPSVRLTRLTSGVRSAHRRLTSWTSRRSSMERQLEQIWRSSM